MAKKVTGPFAKALVWILALVGALIGIMLGVGAMLPVGHVASGSTTRPAAPADVYRIVADVAAYPRWWSEISAVEMLPSTSGRLRFRQQSSTGPIVMEVEEAAPPARFVTRIADPDQPFGGTWTFEIAPEGTGSRLTITERGEVYNPLFRFLSRFVFGHTGTIESFLNAFPR